MIECIFTLDYEIYGNGDGSLHDLVYEPAERLISIFHKADSKFVAFIECAELELIDTNGTDSAIGLVKDQIRKLYTEGFELGLHLHPQWYNARHENGQWELDYNEYNLCTLPRERIVEIVDQSIAYFRNVLDQSNFTPFSFRAGNWLLQPTQVAAGVLAEKGIKLDSSVFKGGLQHRYGLDYRKAINNGYYWTFSEHVDTPDPNGILLEIPTYTKMVPSWKMITRKRLVGKKTMASATKPVSLAKKGAGLGARFIDFLRFTYPLKLDFCRMGYKELTGMINEVILEEQKNPGQYRPIVAIGHTKDFIDYASVESFLSYLKDHGIKVSTFKDVYAKCN